MYETIAVGCRYCGWISYRDRVKLERDRLIACQSCRSLMLSNEAEAAGKEIETRLSLIGVGRKPVQGDMRGVAAERP